MLSLIHSHYQWKILATVTSLAIGLTSIVALIPQASGEPAAVQKTFTITAYYSPLPDQSVYLTGTFSGDKRINGNGTNGADGTQVFAGFIAAPSTYAFGTKIHCPPFISGVVHDRGGAIVKSGVRGNTNDRLDLWAGRGEEGLKKALFWGRRSLQCTVYSPQAEKIPSVFANLPDGNLGKFALSMLKKAIPEGQVVSDMNRYFDLLATLGYNPHDEDYRIAFQIRHQIIKDENDPAAGNIGPNTRKTLEKLNLEIAKTLPREGLEEGHEGEDVRKLQALLFDAGYLSVQPTGAFKALTKEALATFQLEQKIINSAAHRAAGYLGPGTKKALLTIAAKKFGISEQDQLMIRELKMDEIRTMALAQAEALQKQAPEKEKKDEDPVQEALKLLTSEWIQDHTAEDSSEKGISKTALANVNLKVQTLVNPFTMRLGPGIKHPEVKKLQVFLKTKGFFTGSLITDVFGTETRKAVITLQLRQKLIASKTQADAGIVGPKTLAALNALHYQDEFSLPIAVASKIRAPAVHPRDLKIGKSTPLSSRPS